MKLKSEKPSTTQEKKYMPKILSPFIHENLPGLWLEGAAYEKKNIYSIQSGNMPPVNYDVHTFKSHSLTHVETSLHTQKDGNPIDEIYKNKISSLYGLVIVLRLKGDKYQCINKDPAQFHWVITLEQILESLTPYKTELNNIKKIFITTDSHKTTKDGFHDPNYVLTLSQEAADYLVNELKINLYGTSWKSSDYNPGKSERPIHNTLFKTAIIVECLDLSDVEEDVYFLVCAPLPIIGASESPVVPMLFTKNEIKNIF